MQKRLRSNASAIFRVERLLVAGSLALGIGLIGWWTQLDVLATSAPPSYPAATLFPDQSTAEGTHTVSPVQSTYTVGTDITVEATGAVDPNGDWDYALDYWEGLNTSDFPSGPGGVGTSGGNPLTYTLTSGTPLRCLFFLRYRLRTFTDGEGSVSPSGGFFRRNSTVYLTPTPDPGWEFSHWELALSGNQVPAALVMNLPKWVRAVFTPLPTYTLSTTVDGNGTVDLEASPVAPGVYWEGAIPVISATPSPGWAFDHWEGDLTGSANPTSIAMTSDKAVQAVFRPIVEFSAASSTVEESAGIVEIPVTLAAAFLSEVTVDYTVTGGDATEGEDFTLAAGPLEFDPNETEATIAISIDEDLVVELSETIEITLSNPTNAVLGTETVYTLTIQDGAVVRFLTGTSTVSETDTTGSALVTLGIVPQEPVSVDYAVTAGSATGDGVDYTLAAGTLDFEQGGISAKNIDFEIHDDDIFELDEAFTITLSNPTNALLGTPATHFVLLENDDPLPTVQFTLAASEAEEDDGIVGVEVTLSHRASKFVAVDFSLSGTTIATDYTSVPAPPTSLFIGPGLTSKSININVTDDNQDELAETVILHLDSASIAGQVLNINGIDEHTLTIEDNEPPTEVEFMFRAFSLNEGYSVANGDVPVNITSSVESYAVLNLQLLLLLPETTGTYGADFTTHPNMSSGPTGFTFWAAIPYYNFDIDILEDNVDEHDELVVVRIDSLDADPFEANIGDDDIFTLTIEDNDPTPEVNFGLQNDSVDEDYSVINGRYVLDVTLSNPSADTVHVSYVVEGQNNDDYTVSPENELIIGPGQTQGKIFIDIHDDDMLEAGDYLTIAMDQLFTVPDPDLQNATPLGVLPGGTTTFELAIGDNDLVPTVGFMGTTQSTNEEEEENVEVKVALSNPSEDDIVVSVVLDGDSSAENVKDYTIAPNLPTNITILAGTQEETIHIDIVDDGIHEIDESIVLKLAEIVDGGTLGADLGDTLQHTVTITDNEQPPSLSFDPTTLPVTEGDDSVMVDVKLSHKSGVEVSVPLTFDGQAALGEDYTIDVENPLIFAPEVESRKITITNIDDDIVELQEHAVLTLSDPIAEPLDVTIEPGFGMFDLVIDDNDDPPVVYFTLDETPPVTEGDTIIIHAQLSRMHSEGITVDLDIGESTADVDADFTLAHDVLEFPAHSTTANLQITILDDGLAEDDETIVVKLSDPTSSPLDYEVGTGPPNHPSHTVTIEDDDEAFTAHWPFDASLANLGNDIGGTHNVDLMLGTQANAAAGIVIGAMSITPGAPTAPVAVYDVSGAPSVLDLSTHMTVMTWFQLTGAGADYVLLSKGDPENSNTGYQVVVNPELNNSAGIMLRYGDGTDYISAYSTDFAFEVGEWYHLGIVFELGTTTFYINGEPAGTTFDSARGFVANTADFKVGADAANENQFDGVLDELILQNEALAALDVRAEYENVTHTLTTETTGQGQINLTPQPTAEGYFFHGVEVQLDAVADTGWSFEEWDGTDVGDLENSDENSARIRMNGDKTISATFEENPIANFDIEIDGLEVTFTSTSYEPPGETLTYTWEFGDGTVLEDAEPTEIHTYLVKSDYSAMLTVKNSGGMAEDSITRQVNLAGGLEAAIKVEIRATTESYDILLTDVSVPADGQEIDGWEWTSDELDIPNPTAEGPHTVEEVEAGSYNVTLKVTQSADMAMSSITVPIDIGEKPTALFDAAPNPQLVDHDVVFTDESTEGGAEITQWEWDFGDGSPLVYGPGPHTHAYGANGTFPAKLTVRNSFGTNSTTMQIEIDPQPLLTDAPDFVVSITDLEVNDAPPSGGAQVMAGDSISVTSTVSNNGISSPPTGRNDALYLSLNETLDENDLKLHDLTTSGALTGGSSEPVTLETTGLQDVAPGTYYLIVNADDDGAIGEVAENNNTAFIGIVVVDTVLTDE